MEIKIIIHFYFHDNITITNKFWELISLISNTSLYWAGISANPNITWDIIQANPDNS
jgi:hypothetical protein